MRDIMQTSSFKRAFVYAALVETITVYLCAHFFFFLFRYHTANGNFSVVSRISFALIQSIDFFLHCPKHVFFP